MFDIGIWELVLIMVIALIVLGPERLPEVARTLGHLLGKARSIARSVKSEIDRELAAEELQRVLGKQAESADPFEMIEKAVTPPAPKQATPTPPQSPAPPQTPAGTADQEQSPPAHADNAANDRQT